jgi:hypothetical protein
MNHRIVPLLQILHIDEWLIGQSRADLAAADFTRRPADRGNSFAWIFGHIIDARFLMARLVGLTATFPHADLFARGQAYPTADRLPAVPDLQHHWDEIVKPLHDRLDLLSDAELDADTGREFPHGDGSVAGALSFLTLHESYHVGQLGYLRVLLGYPPIVK